MKRRLRNNIQEYSAYLGLPNDMYSPALMKGNKVLDVPKSYTMSGIRAKPTKTNSSECYVSEKLPATDVHQPTEPPVQLSKIEEPVYDPSTVNLIWKKIEDLSLKNPTNLI